MTHRPLRSPASLALAVLLAAGPWGPARAEPLAGLGLSGVEAVPEATWQAMPAQARLALLEQRAELAKAMGARVVRIGAAAPLLFTTGALAGAAGFRDWALADAAVAAFRARGLGIVLTLPQVPATADRPAWEALVRAAAERYDGDGDFGVADGARNYEYPDVDGSGAITAADWSAPVAALAAWGQAHRVDVVQLGDAPDRAEDAGVIAVGAYALQVNAGRAAVAAAASELQVQLAGTALDRETATRFAARLEGLTAPPDLSDGQPGALTGDPTQNDAIAALDALTGWVAALSGTTAAPWIGAASVPSQAGANARCAPAHCTERTQASGLVRLALASLAAGHAVFAWDRPLEVTGSAADAGAAASTGLVTLALDAGGDPLLTPLSPRPAYAVFVRLAALLADLAPGELAAANGLPANTGGVRLGSAGWVLWYDWTREVAAGKPYGGAKKLVTLSGLGASAAVSVTPLWPSALDPTIGASYTAAAQWDVEVLPVVGGEVTVSVGQDAVWVAATGTAPPPDTGAGEAGPEIAEPPPPGSGDDGCAAGASHGGRSTPTAPAPWAPWLGLGALGIVALARRSGR